MAVWNKLSLVAFAVAVHSIAGLDCYHKDFNSESQTVKACRPEEKCCYNRLAKVERLWREAKGCNLTCTPSQAYGSDFGTTMNYVCKEELCNKASKLPAATSEGPEKCWAGRKVEETCSPVDRCCKRAEYNFTGQLGVIYYGCSFIDCDEAVRGWTGYTKWYNCPTDLCNDGEAYLSRSSPNPDGPARCYWKPSGSLEGIIACKAGDKCCQATVAEGRTLKETCARDHCDQGIRIEANASHYSCNANLCQAIPAVTTIRTEANTVKPNITVKNTNTTENTKLTQKPNSAATTTTTTTTMKSPAKNATKAATTKAPTNQSLITTKAPAAETTTTIGPTKANKGSTSEATTTKSPSDEPTTTKSPIDEPVTSQKIVATTAATKGTDGLCPKLALPLATIALYSLILFN